VRAQPSAATSLDGQFAALALRADIPAHEQEPACHDGIALPAPRGDSRRRRWIAGAVIVTASLVGVLCAIVISADGGHGGAPMLGTSAAQAATRSSPMPLPRPDVVTPAAPGPPSSAPASRSAGSPSPGGAGELAPPAPSTPPPPSTPGSPSPDRPLPSGKHPSNPDTRGDHANTRPRAAPSIADLKRHVSQNVTRGD
jgi:hypothetical protein